MTVQNWSDNITVVELNEEPQFTDELTGLTEGMGERPVNVVLNFAGIGFINSSNVAKLLRLRKLVLGNQRRLIFCGVNTQVWGVFLVTGLDKIFEFTNDVSTALATLQLSGRASRNGQAGKANNSQGNNSKSNGGKKKQ
ncbi:MAG: STAS domain-containing protein [Phycisphaerae bacterium]